MGVLSDLTANNWQIKTTNLYHLSTSTITEQHDFPLGKSFTKGKHYFLKFAGTLPSGGLARPRPGGLGGPRPGG